MQTVLPFFQQLLSDWYQFTLDNLVYALSLAVAVWLLTAIFYSLRIGFLNRRIRLNTEAAQQQIQQLQEQMEQAKATAEQESQRAATLQEHISGLSKQLSEGIQTLAANLDLGEQFMPAADNVETEDLVQRYSSSIKQLIERLRTEQKTTTEWQQAYRAETAKLAQKDLELGALQSRVDTQSQQLAQWELIIDEHKTLLKQHQENAEHRLAEALQKHQADLARFATLGQQTRDWPNAKHQQVQHEVQLKTQDALSAQREQTPPVETIPFQPQPAQIELEQIAVAEPATTETHEEQPASDVNEFFASIMQPIEQRDEGQNNPITEPELQSETDQINKESQTIITETYSNNSQAINAGKEQSTGMTGKLKNLFSASKESSTTEAQATPEQSSPESSGANKKVPAKVKNLLGKFKRK